MIEMIGVMTEVAKRLYTPKISRANIATTFRCNHKCITCNIWKDNNKQNINEEITSWEMEQIITKNNLFWVSLTGGEPFLNSDIKRIIEIAMKNCKMVSIICNGSMPSLIENCAFNGLTKGDALLVINLSLEGNEEFHDKIIGVKGSYNRVVETIERLKKIKDERLIVGIEHMISGHTNGHYKEVEKFAKKYNVQVTYTAEQYSSYYNNLGNKIIKPDKPKQRWGIHPMTVFSDMFLTGAFTGRSNKCVAGEYSCFIDPYTTVYPCLLNTPTHPIKNLRNTDYIIGKLDCGNVVKNCKGCWTPCETYATMLFRPMRLI